MIEATSYIKIDIKTYPCDTSYINLVKYFAEIGWRSNIKDFYLQEFTYDLIVKYFAGWDYNGAEIFSCKVEGSNRSHVIEFMAFNKYRILSNKMNPDWLYHFKPRTLNDFMSDCERAGVKLFWR